MTSVVVAGLRGHVGAFRLSRRAQTRWPSASNRGPARWPTFAARPHGRGVADAASRRTGARSASSCITSPAMYPLEIQLAQMLAGGQPVTGVTWDDVHAMNAAHAEGVRRASRRRRRSICSGATARRPRRRSARSATRSSIGRRRCRSTPTRRSRASSCSRITPSGTAITTSRASAAALVKAPHPADGFVQEQSSS